MQGQLETRPTGRVSTLSHAEVIRPANFSLEMIKLKLDIFEWVALPANGGARGRK
jgi:hypothetical protein